MLGHIYCAWLSSSLDFRFAQKETLLRRREMMRWLKAAGNGNNGPTCSAFCTFGHLWAEIIASVAPAPRQILAAIPKPLFERPPHRGDRRATSRASCRPPILVAQVQDAEEGRE